MECQPMMSTIKDSSILESLSKEEVEKISQVLQRDLELNLLRQEHLRLLKQDIAILQEMSEKEMSEGDVAYTCQLCRQVRGCFLGGVEKCPTCRRKVCNLCRRKDSYGLGLLTQTQLESLRRKEELPWSCALCYKLKEYKVCSGQWIMEGPGNTAEINRKDTKMANMNHVTKERTEKKLAFPVNESVDDSDVYKKKLKDLILSIPNGVSKTSRGTNSVPSTLNDSAKGHHDDEDELSSTSDEPQGRELNEVNMMRSSDDSEADVDVLELHERHSQSEGPSPHEVSSLTLYIREPSSIFESISPRTIRITSVRGPAITSFQPSPPSSFNGMPSVAPHKEEDEVAKSVLIKKLFPSTPVVPKPSSIKLLSVSSQQKEANSAAEDKSLTRIDSRDHADIRSSILSGSQQPSGLTGIRVDHLDSSSLYNGGTWRNSHDEELNEESARVTHTNSQTANDISSVSIASDVSDSRDSENVPQDGVQCAEVKVKDRVRYLENQSKKEKITDVAKGGLLNGTKKDVQNETQINEGKSETEPEGSVKFDFYFGGDSTLLVPISKPVEDSLSQTDKKREKEKEASLDGTANDTAIGTANDTTKDSLSQMNEISGAKHEAVVYFSFDQTTPNMNEDPRLQHYYLNGIMRSYEKRFPLEDGWIELEQENNQQEVDEADGNVEHFLENRVEHPREEEVRKVKEESKEEDNEGSDEISCLNDEVKKPIEPSLNGEEHQEVEERLEEDKNDGGKVEGGTMTREADEVQGQVQKEETGKDESHERDFSNEELWKFLERINREIDGTVAQQNTAREELLTQQQLRLDIYIRELNDHVQQSQGSDDSTPGLDEEEWVAEVERIQNEEVRGLLEEQQSELEALNRVRRSILRHLEIREDDNGVLEGRTGKESEEEEEEEEEEVKDGNVSTGNESKQIFESEIVETKLEPSDVDQFVPEFDNEITYMAITDMKNAEAATDESLSSKYEKQILNEDVEKFADNLTKEVMEEAKDAELGRINVYTVVAGDPKVAAGENGGSKLNKFLTSGEDFDEVSRSTTTFGDEISTVTTTVYKKSEEAKETEEDLGESTAGQDEFKVSSGDLLQDIEADLESMRKQSEVNGKEVGEVTEVNGVTEVSQVSGGSVVTNNTKGASDVEAQDGSTTGGSSGSPQPIGEVMTHQLDRMHAGRTTLAGQIHFGLHYDEDNKTLEIHVHECRDVAIAGRTNTYVKTYLMPDKTRKGKRKTHTRKNADHPVFNQILKYKIPKNELETRVLSLTVWHNVTFGKNEILGEVVLPLENINLHDKEGRWHPVHRGIENQRWKSILELNQDSKLELSVTFSTKGAISEINPPAGDLCVKVVQAKSLTSFRENLSCDAFVECYLHVPPLADVKGISSVVRSTGNPEWNQEFCFGNVTLEQLKNSKLEVSIWTKEGLTEKEFLGGVKMFSGEDVTNPEIELWEKMLKSPNEIFTSVLPLRSAMDDPLRE